MSDEIAPGVVVEHSVWGRGKVVAVSPLHVVVHFPALAGTEQGPRRKLQLGATQLSPSVVTFDPTLDGVAIGADRIGKKRTGSGGSGRAQRPSARPLDFAITWFRTKYPGLFQDPKLVDQELGYKREAHARFVTRLGRGRGARLLSSGALPEIAAILDELYHATNIPHRFEVMAAHDGFKDGPSAGRVLGAALDFVDAPGAHTFQALVEAIGSLPAPAQGSRVLTWPNVTILPFLADPTRFMVLKPGIAQKAAARIGFDLLYSSAPNWHCYEALQRMSALLLKELSVLGAVDYIDVQSFMWVTRGVE